MTWHRYSFWNEKHCKDLGQSIKISHFLCIGMWNGINLRNLFLFSKKINTTYAACGWRYTSNLFVLYHVNTGPSCVFYDWDYVAYIGLGTLYNRSCWNLTFSRPCRQKGAFCTNRIVFQMVGFVPNNRKWSKHRYNHQLVVAIAPSYGFPGFPV